MFIQRAIINSNLSQTTELHMLHTAPSQDNYYLPITFDINCANIGSACENSNASSHGIMPSGGGLQEAQTLGWCSGPPCFDLSPCHVICWVITNLVFVSPPLPPGVAQLQRWPQEVGEKAQRDSNWLGSPNVIRLPIWSTSQGRWGSVCACVCACVCVCVCVVFTRPGWKMETERLSRFLTGSLHLHITICFFSLGEAEALRWGEEEEEGGGEGCLWSIIAQYSSTNAPIDMLIREGLYANDVNTGGSSRLRKSMPQLPRHKQAGLEERTDWTVLTSQFKGFWTSSGRNNHHNVVIFNPKSSKTTRWWIVSCCKPSTSLITSSLVYYNLPQLASLNI